MATELSQDEVLAFLRLRGGKVRNSELLGHFRYFLQHAEDKAHNRELFKRFVNTLAVVQHEEGATFVALRKKFQDTLSAPTGTKPWDSNAKPKPPVSYPDSTQDKGHIVLNAKHQIKYRVDAIPENTSDHRQKTSDWDKTVRPNADAASHRYPNQPTSQGRSKYQLPDFLDKVSQSFKPLTEKPRAHHQEPVHLARAPFPLPTSPGSQVQSSAGTPARRRSPESKSRRASNSQLPDYTKGDLTAGPEQRPHVQEFQDDNQHRHLDPAFSYATLPAYPGGTDPSGDNPPRRRSKHLKSPRKSPVSHPLVSSVNATPDRQVQPEQKNGTPKSSKDDQQNTPQPVNIVPDLTKNLDVTLKQTEKLDVTWKQTPPPIVIPDVPEVLSDSRIVKRGFPRLRDSITSSRSWQHGDTVATSTICPTPLRHSLPITSPQPSGASERPHTMLPSSYCDIQQAVEMPGRRDVWASEDGLDKKGLCHESGSLLSDPFSALKRASERRMATRHHSADSLGDGEPPTGESEDESVSKVPMRTRSQKVRDIRSRMCRSVGADLDQPFLEGAVLARQNRLQLLSSSLSISYPQRPAVRSQSARSLTGSVISRSTSRASIDGSPFQRSALAPIDPKEHDWLLKAASGCWTEIYVLFREEPSLLDRRDFITGYTVLHWIAKHGDHRVLNTLSYGAEKIGASLDVNTRTTCGYTPLHLAAIHGHRKLIRLLVHKFRANVGLRDSSGRKAWQYLERHSLDLMQLLGAPLHKAAGGKLQSVSGDKLQVRPISGSPQVKRHSSIAAFLKHKPFKKVANSESFV